MVCWRLELDGNGAIFVYDAKRLVTISIPIPIRDGDNVITRLEVSTARDFAQAILDAAEAVDGIKAVVRVEGGDDDAKTCATCEHWGGRFGDPPKVYTDCEYECIEIGKKLLIDIEYFGYQAGGGTIGAIETPHDFGCVLHEEVAGD